MKNSKGGTLITMLLFVFPDEETQLKEIIWKSN
jgi:hypothetical protein